ncbi:MAG: radical SAM protein [Planctomycetota bacterium]
MRKSYVISCFNNKIKPIYLRLSITSQCNLRCLYCRPHIQSDAGLTESPLSHDQLVALVSAVQGVAPIYKLRLTGGEPLLRAELPELIRSFRNLLPAVELCMTTNGLLLADRVEALKAAGLQSLNISLDTTRPDRFYRLSRSRGLARILSGIAAARNAGFDKLKLNTVLMRSYNADQLADLIRVAARNQCEIRFVELMPFGQGAHLFEDEYVSADEALSKIRSAFEYAGPLEASATARRHLIHVDGRDTAIGFITGMSRLFCPECDRLRLDSFGHIFSCLRSEKGADLGALLRRGNLEALSREIAETLARKTAPRASWPERSMVLLGG